VKPSVDSARAIQTVVGLAHDAVEHRERAAHFAACQRQLVTRREGTIRLELPWSCLQSAIGALDAQVSFIEIPTLVAFEFALTEWVAKVAPLATGAPIVQKA
jgi:hypothetical protein